MKPIRRLSLVLAVVALALAGVSRSHAQQQGGFDGVSNSLETLYRVSNAKTRSIGPENLTGAKGEGAMAAIIGGDDDAAVDLGDAAAGGVAVEEGHAVGEGGGVGDVGDGGEGGLGGEGGVGE